MKNQVLKKFQKWFAARCDGDWEHAYGVKIETLDNPGWYLEVNLQGTGLDGRVFEKIDLSRSRQDWVVCQVNDKMFEGYGGPLNLEEIIEIFLEWSS